MADKRKEYGTVHTCMQRLRAWEKRNIGTSPHLRRLLMLICVLVLAYRLLLLPQRWPAEVSVGRRLEAGSGSLSHMDAQMWLPPPWVGQPPPVDPLACTPQLLIIGVMKGGTTALFHYLNGSQPAVHYPNGSKSHVDYSPRFHPAIIGTHVTKELHFFDKQPVRVKNRFSQHIYFGSFPGVDMNLDNPTAGNCSYPKKLGLTKASWPALVRMEATAMYFAHPSAAGNVKSLLPQARLVLLLREPVSRALSSVNMIFQRSPEFAHLKEGTLEYRQAWQSYVITELRRQVKVLSDCFDRLRPADPVYDQIDHCVFDPTGTLQGVLHIHVGLYAVHLERWFTNFTPDQLLIWSSTAFEEKPRQHMEQLVEWLGIDLSLTKPDDGQWQKLHERSYPTASLPAALFDEVTAFFTPHNERALQLLEQAGYRELVGQLRQAWTIELQETISHLQQ